MRTTPPEVYLAAAADRNMTIVGVIPTNTLEKLVWHCNNCKRTYNRSLKEMRSVPRCRCQGKNAVTETLYAELGKALGITWIGKTLPVHTRDLTRWKGYDGVEFEAPYAQLSRPNIPKRYREHLSPDYEAPPSNYHDVPHTAMLKRIKEGR